ncbi:hypothetical protein LUZ61_021144 [Rhynchospora tenuis]|uniref:Protein kinase domain-containing protein n=1 Tax=Rhynchospora tenuis TaxID=198213 RepID=A0AAD5W7R1_9POAL|nr:hypothetical protein LUZ61_021144 [Rhynchospora tenuis]
MKDLIDRREKANGIRFVLGCASTYLENVANLLGGLEAGGTTMVVVVEKARHRLPCHGFEPHECDFMRGYINIDCGIASNTSYVDSFTGLTYASDDPYIDRGINSNVSSQYTLNENYTNLETLRSFPSNIRNCYTLEPVTEGLKYLLRATFYYGNYDKTRKPPIFDLYFGVNFWSTVNISTLNNWYPFDAHDRLWISQMQSSWTAISTSSKIGGFSFEVPSLVLQTAASPLSVNGSIDITWKASDQFTKFFVVLHISEIQVLSNSSLREFCIFADGVQNFKDPIRLNYLWTLYALYTDTGCTDYNMSLKSTARSTLPPILNAFEVYTIVPSTKFPTDTGDGTPVNRPSDREGRRNIDMGSSSNVFENPKESVLAGRKELNIDKRKFSFMELKQITNNFRDQIGAGGFGKVFKGQLEDGNEVAVKVRTELSSHGAQQFLNEVEKLSRVYHKNLVSLVGYCLDGDHIALVYQHMQKGNLQYWIRGGAHSLQWKERLRIAYESAQGFEYLHKMCNPPLIHRDIKSNNILLTANLEAKVSDFGSVRDCTGTHVTTQVIGTDGYLDPYYASTSQLTEKTDVYSFGVVLLEIVTGKSPILEGPQGSKYNLTQFVQERLSKGKIESILDPNMGGKYNMNSIWKVADLALRCTDHPDKRPDMTEVITELKEASNIEMSTFETSSVASEDISQYSGYSRNDFPTGAEVHGGDFEMARMGSLQLPDYGPLAR